MRPRKVNRRSARPVYTRSYARSNKPSRPAFRMPKLPTFSGSWIRAAIIATAVLICLVVIAHLTALRSVIIQGNKALTNDRLNGLTNAALKQQWFGRNLLLVNTGAIEESIASAEPAVKDVKVRRQFMHKLVVSVTERQPSLNWKTGDSVYLLDSDGTVIGPTKGEYAKLPTVTDANSLPVKVGQRVAPTSFVAFCQQVAALLPPAGYPITSMTVPASTSEVHIQTGNLLLKFDTTRPAGEAIADLAQVQKELAKAKKTPTQYIDLRIEHKAYYK